MEKKKQIRLSERTHITQYFNKKGDTVAEFSERTLIMPASSTQANKLKLINRLQELSDNLEISGAFANEMARIIKNSKKRKNCVVRREKQYIVTAKNDALYKRTFKTALKQLQIAKSLFDAADKYGIDDEGRDSLAKEIRSRYFGLADFPKDFVGMPKAYRDAFPLPKNALRHWYAAYLGKPQWDIENVDDETIKDFFDKKCEEATNLPFQDCPSERLAHIKKDGPDATRAV